MAFEVISVRNVALKYKNIFKNRELIVARRRTIGYRYVFASFAWR